MAVLLSGTTIGGNAAIHAGNISTYALTSIPTTISPNNIYIGNAIYFGGANNYLNWTNSRIYSNVSIQSGAAVYSSDWFRSYGSNGWYNESYGGGIYMTDGTWVRVYNNKQFLVENLIQSNTAVYAPIFYDSADNSYYLNPNGVSSLAASHFSDGILDNASARIAMLGGAYNVNNPSGTGGAIRINLPTATYGSNTMMSMTVHVYEYSTGQSFTLKVGGYNYFTHDWYNVFAYLLNDSGKGSDVPVYFGNDGTRDVIWIGEPSWSWSYPNVFVTDFQAGHSQNSSWKTGWSISFDTSARTNVSASRTAYRQIDIGNIGSQSVSYATNSGNSATTSQTTFSSLTVNNNSTFSGQSTWFGGYGGGSGPGIALENLSTFARFAFWGLDFYDWNNGIQMTIDNGYVSAANSFRAPIFYDSQDTGFYVDPNSNSRLSQVYVDNLYNYGWFRNYGNQGIYNQDYGTHFYSNGGASWAITGSGGNVELQFRSNHQSTIRGYVYADTSNQIGFLHSGGGWAFRTTSDKNALVHGTDLTINADGAGSSNIVMNDGDEGSRIIHCNSNRIGFLTQAGNWGSWCDDDGNWTSVGNLAGAYLYSNYSVRVGEIWGQGGLYRSSGIMLFGTENEGWRFSMANSQKMYIGTDGNIWMAWAGDYISNLLAAKLSTSGKAADSEAVDGIDSSRIVFGDGASKISSHSNANDWRDSGFYENGGGGSNWPSQTWYNSINVRHSNQGNYHGFQLAMSYYDNNLWFRSYQGYGSFQSWAYAISSQNIGSQSVNYANSAGDSTNLGGRSSSRYLYYRGISSSGDFQSFQSSESIIRFDQVNDSNGLSNPPGGYNWGGVLSMRGDNFGLQIWGAHTGELWFKTQWNNDQYSGWRYIVHSGNIGSQSVNYANSAGSAGTWSTARNLTIGASTKSINGSANVSFSLAEIDAAPRGIDATINVMTDSGTMELVFQKGALISATPI